jgi:transposase-like protein
MGAEGALWRRARGLSETEFRARYGTEEACRATLFALRWGKGWVCPACGHGRCAELKVRAVYQCNRCKHQVSLTAGTAFHWTKLPLTTWFLAIYHLTQSKGGMSSIELARRLGTRQPTAWLMKQKLMQAMQLRDAAKPKLAGRIELDDAYLGGERSGGKRGRGSPGKTPFVAAVETTAERKPRRMRLTVVGGCRKKLVEQLAKSDFTPGSNIVSDGLSCWEAVKKAGCQHFPMPTGSGRKAAQWVPFRWVNTALGNIKTALAGTYHHRAFGPIPRRDVGAADRVSPKHAQRYLASFAWRFNRRSQLDSLTERLAWACARTAPHPYRVITAG